MKTASFEFKSTQFGKKLLGRVTLKDDGKISISFPFDSYGISYAQKYQAKQLAKQIVAADFKHEAIYGEVKSTENQKGLVEKLKNATGDLKTEFLNRTEKYANERFSEAEKRKPWKMAQWLEEYGYDHQFKHSLGTDRLLTTFGKKLFKSDIKILKTGHTKFIQEEMDEANAHYNDSICRLAVRLNNKGITDQSNIKISNGKVKENFECYITHENGITKAWTIIASGPVQRPHYRYLVK